ncbi:MAG: hypothetical protein J7K04_16465 [Spirochaetales bacterium]|nr:hypothetical protein [Spirochaetales bacterium]
MKMKKLIFLPLAVIAVFFSSCAGSPKVEKPAMIQEAKPEIIDDQYHGARETPDWVFLDENELLTKEKDYYVFKFQETGKDLDGLKLWTRGFTASSEIARLVSTKVKDKFVGAAAGDKDKLETYMEEVVKSVSQAQYSGALRKASYWWQIRKVKVDGSVEDVYEYYLLYYVPKDQIDSAIERALQDMDKKVKPKSEDEKTARSRVKEAFSNGL